MLLAATAACALSSATAPAASALQRCKVPDRYGDNTFAFRANVPCREARRALNRRRCSNDPCTKFVSRGKRGRYRCRVRPNNIGGANWRCTNRRGRDDVIRFRTRS